VRDSLVCILLASYVRYVCILSMIVSIIVIHACNREAPTCEGLDLGTCEMVHACGV
jgi:hypothetical protein